MLDTLIQRVRTLKSTPIRFYSCTKNNPRKLQYASLGFTLIELIVVITILAILGTIGFLSIRNVADSSRDATRLSDIKNITASLDYYLTQKGTVPRPTNETTVTYSGATAWYQWTFGTSVIIPLDNPNKVPLDPLLATEYTYSVTNNQKQYQLSGIYEWDAFAVRSIIPTANALDSNARYKTFVTGNYNGSILKINSTLLAVPSIVLGNTTAPGSTELKTMGGYNFTLKNSYNPPAALNTIVNTTIVQSDKPYVPAFEELKNGTSNKVAVWTGSTLPKTTSDITIFSTNFKEAYLWTNTNNSELQQIVASSGDALKYKSTVLLNAEFRTNIDTTVYNTSQPSEPPATLEPCTFTPTGTWGLFDNCSL